MFGQTYRLGEYTAWSSRNEWDGAPRWSGHCWRAAELVVGRVVVAGFGDEMDELVVALTIVVVLVGGARQGVDCVLVVDRDVAVLLQG